jgi:hypothetical protein
MKGVDGRRDEWARLSRAWERSGQTQAEFCASQEIELGTFRWWRWRLGGEREKTLVASATREPGSSWVEVSREGHDEQPVAGSRSSDDLRLVFCDGLEIHVPVGFDGETLRRVLAVLGEMTC